MILHPRPTWTRDGSSFLDLQKICPIGLDVNLDYFFMESADMVDPGSLVCSGSRVGCVIRSELVALGEGMITYRIFATPVDNVCSCCLAAEVMLT